MYRIGSKLLYQVEPKCAGVTFSSAWISQILVPVSTVQSFDSRCNFTTSSSGLRLVKLSLSHRHPVTIANQPYTIRLISTSILNLSLQNQKSLKYTPPKTNIETHNAADAEINATKSSIKSAHPISQAAEDAKKMIGSFNVKELFKKYGLPFMVYYSSLYFGCGVGIYLLIDTGVLGIGGEDIINWVKQSPLQNYFDVSRINPLYCNIGGAIVANELFEVVRLPFALLTIPYVKGAWDGRKTKKELK